MSSSKRPADHVVAVVGGPVDEMNLCLALYSEQLDPDDVTKVLGVSPTSSRRRGESRPRGAPFREGAWFLERRCAVPENPDHVLQELLSQVALDADVWRTLKGQHRIQVRLGVHFSGWNKGFEFSPETLSVIAVIGAELMVDIYADDAEE